MFYDFMMAWRNIADRPVQTVMTILLVGLAIALSIAVTYLNDGLQRAIRRAGDPFGALVVGAKGSAGQLVLSTLLLQGDPIGTIPGTIYTSLVADPRVSSAVPLMMGDTVGNAHIIGTTTDFFTLGSTGQERLSFQLAAGRFFAADFEVVLGSQAATELGLAINSQFLPVHGLTQGSTDAIHNSPHTIVGILQPTHTVYDRAVFTSLESVNALHRPDRPDESATAVQEGSSATTTVTAILVQTVDRAEQTALLQELNAGAEAQAFLPAPVIRGIFALFNQGQELLSIVGSLATVMAALTLFLAIYSTTGAREHLVAIMRGLGANRALIFRIVLWETILIALLGSLVGRLLGYGLAAVVADRISSHAVIPITIRFLPQLEGWLWGFAIVIGIAAGLVPAAQAYRANVVERLFPS